MYDGSQWSLAHAHAWRRLMRRKLSRDRDGDGLQSSWLLFLPHGGLRSLTCVC